LPFPQGGNRLAAVYLAVGPQGQFGELWLPTYQPPSSLILGVLC
jgi:hypothetical protein